MKKLTYEEYKKILEKYPEYWKNPKKVEKVNNKYDKIFKTILENKEEAANFINQALKLNKKIKPKEIEKYSSSFITKNFEAQESDIIYKIKNKKVFIIIEHQTKIDFSMSYRILNYQMEIMRSCIEEKELKNKDYKQALVIAIVLYTGPRKWTAKTHIRETQENLENEKLMLGNYETLGNYNTVDVTNYTEKELLESKSFLSKIMLLEKSETKEEFLKNLEEIIPKINKTNKEILSRIIKNIYKEYFNEETIKEMTRKIEEGGDNMLASVQMLEREKRREEKERRREIKLGEARGEARGEVRGKAIGRTEGVKLGRKKEKIILARKMLKENLAIEIIERITGLKREKFM